jgi:hypothetical protein
VGENWCCTKDMSCLKGYRGILCRICDNEKGYFSNGSECSKCDKSSTIYLKIVGLILFTLTMILLTIIGIK